MAKDRLLIYGATGYMGRLLAELAAKERSGKVILAGRNAARLAEMAERLGLPYRAFALESPTSREAALRREKQAPPTRRTGSATTESQPAIPPGSAQPAAQKQESPLELNHTVDAALADVQVVLNAAGPFGDTAPPLARACCRTRTHYLDIGGEYAVFRSLDDLGHQAATEGVTIMPGVGLSVLGSDLLVRRGIDVARQSGMDEPHVVRVALSRVPFVSRGSAKTMLDAVRDGVLVRRNGELRVTPIGQLVRTFEFQTNGKGATSPRLCTALTLADAHTVGFTAARLWSPPKEAKPVSVPNVETYVEASALEHATYEAAGNFSLALRSRPLKGMLDRALGAWPEGPSAEERAKYQQELVVELEDRFRRAVILRLVMPNSYDFTAQAALLVAKRVAGATPPHVGFVSPAQAFPSTAPVELRDCQLTVTSRGIDIVASETRL